MATGLIEIIEPGMYTTVQDYPGRLGYCSFSPRSWQVADDGHANSRVGTEGDAAWPPP